MDEIVRQCVLTSESDISDNKESNYGDEDVLLSTSSCLHTETHDDEEQSLPGENKYNKHECISMIMYVVLLYYKKLDSYSVHLQNWE